MNVQERDELAERLAMEGFARIVLEDCEPEIAMDPQAAAEDVRENGEETWRDLYRVCRTAVDSLLATGWQPPEGRR